MAKRITQKCLLLKALQFYTVQDIAKYLRCLILTLLINIKIQVCSIKMWKNGERGDWKTFLYEGTHLSTWGENLVFISYAGQWW